MNIIKQDTRVKDFIPAINSPETVFFCMVMLFVFLNACHNNPKTLKAKELVKDPKTLNDHIKEDIQNSLAIAVDSNGRINDSLQIPFFKVMDACYGKNDFMPLWSDKGKWLSITNALISYLDTCALDGLFKDDYQYKKITSLKNEMDKDSVKRTDAILWTKADLLLTNAFMHISEDLAQGRLQPDSSAWKNDTSKYNIYFFTGMDKLKNKEDPGTIFQTIQPSLQGYIDLKSGIKNFTDSMDTKRYTYLDYPLKPGDEQDSLRFVKKLQLRLNESNAMEYPTPALPDSVTLSAAIKKYQKSKKITADGKISADFIRYLNTTDIEKFNRIAITLDRFKQLPVKLPQKYIWVNLPGFYLQLHDSDTVSFSSKIICGKPSTPTPFLVSAVSDIVIYPTWTVPESIIKKEMLPALKKNAGYLAKKGLDLYNNNGDKIDPSTVNWSKYSKGIPYKIQQGSGDDNALGVIKFNFSNPYAVYLHDTNQRYLFKKSMRSLSHGCVRVQDWEKLAFYIIRNDSVHILPDTLKYNTDSITTWIANKEKHRIGVKFPIPLFIKYFSCEGINGSIKFYDDIYGDDKRLKDKYFAGK